MHPIRTTTANTKSSLLTLALVLFEIKQIAAQPEIANRLALICRRTYKCERFYDDNHFVGSMKLMDNWRRDVRRLHGIRVAVDGVMLWSAVRGVVIVGCARKDANHVQRNQLKMVDFGTLARNPTNR